MPTAEEMENHSDEAWEVIHALYDQSVNSFSRKKFRSIIYFITKSSFDEVIVLAESAYFKWQKSEGRMSDDDVFKYFCASCWNLIGDVTNAKS